MKTHKTIGKIKFIKKIAMPVPISDEQRKQMADEGVFVSTNEFDRLPLTNKTVMKEILESLKSGGNSDFFTNLNIKDAIMLPAIYRADPNCLISIDEHNYYIIDVVEPRIAGKKQTVNNIEYLKGDHIPGEIMAMDAESGLPVKFVYEAVINKIKTPIGNRQRIMMEINKEIEAWNKRVATIDKAVGPTKLALQIAWVEEKIKERIEVLDSQLEAIRRKQEMNLDSTHPGHKQWMDSLVEGIKNGRFTLKDTFDSLLFLHQSNPSILLKGLEDGSIQVPEELRNGLMMIAAQEIQLKGEKELEGMQKDREREERIEEELPEDKESVETTLRPYTLEDIPESKYTKIDKYKTLGHWKAQIDRQIDGIMRNKEILNKVLESLNGLRGYIGGLQKGQRAEDYLASSEGRTIMDKLNEFLKEAQIFIKGYAVDVIANNTINPMLMGKKGTIGNALIAVALNRIYAIIKKTLVRVEEKVDEVEAGIKNKFEKTSLTLWKSFKI